MAATTVMPIATILADAIAERLTGLLCNKVNVCILFSSAKERMDNAGIKNKRRVGAIVKNGDKVAYPLVGIWYSPGMIHSRHPLIVRNRSIKMIPDKE